LHLEYQERLDHLQCAWAGIAEVLDGCFGWVDGQENIMGRKGDRDWTTIGFGGIVAKYTRFHVFFWGELRHFFNFN
jgi:hypothetical protein